MRKITWGKVLLNRVELHDPYKRPTRDARGAAVIEAGKAG
jgi:hypothetical protein